MRAALFPVLAEGPQLNTEQLPATNLWYRFFRGGVALSALERFLLWSLARHIPADMATALREEWRGLNLIQRSPEWQELRFYPLVRGRVDRTRLPLLPVRDGEVKLLSLALRPTPELQLIHVNFWAVGRQFFNLNASESLEAWRDRAGMTIEAVEHSYRSNLVRFGASQSRKGAE